MQIKGTAPCSDSPLPRHQGQPKATPFTMQTSMAARTGVMPVALRNGVLARPFVRPAVGAAAKRPLCRPAGVAAVDVPAQPLVDSRGFRLKEDGSYDLSAPPPFTLNDIRAAIPAKCFEKNTWRSMAHLAADVTVVFGLAVGAYALNAWWAWPLYWFAQGTMFWALFVVGHDCGHQSFSNSRTLNDFVGNIVHSSILVPYHGWRISHRTHHGNHAHVDNDESWHPTKKSILDKMDNMGKFGRLTFPVALLAFPFYLFSRSPGKQGSHFDPECDLFQPSEKNLVLTSNAFLIGMLGVLATSCLTLGVPATLALYGVPYWIFVVWLDVVTYLHHHGENTPEEQMPWYRGKEWSYLRGGLTTLDRDYGIFNKIHHNIETHVVHHLFPQIPHYHVVEATQAVKHVMGPYYREPVKSPGPLPTHLVEPLVRSFGRDHFVQDEGDIVFYERDPRLSS